MVRELLWTCGLALASVYFFTPTAAAADLAAPEVAGEDLSPIVRQLEAAEFAQRQAASQKLAEAGSAAIPALERAAESASREASSRALDVLRQHWQGSEGELKQAAGEALQRLANSSNRSAAQRAHEVLDPPQTPDIVPIGVVPRARVNLQGQIRGGFGGGGAGFGGGAFGGGGVAIPAGVRRISTRVANGKRDVEVEENGRKIVMQTFPNGNIEVEITQPQNGRDVTRKVEARSLDELKRKDAEAGAAYEQYNGGPAARMANQVLPAPLPPLPVPLQPRVIPIPVHPPAERGRNGEAADPFGQHRAPLPPADAQRLIEMMLRRSP